MAKIIQIRRDTPQNWTDANPTLAQGELGLELDTWRVKIGDGITAWNDLAYRFESTGAGGEADGNTEYINRANTTEDVAPTAGEIADPIDGDSAEINLNNEIVETWKYVSSAWVKRYRLLLPQVLGIEASSNVSGTHAFDYTKKFFGKKTLSANTTFSDTGLVVDGTARGCYLIGDFTPTFPAYWTGDVGNDAYDGTKLHRLTWDVINAASGSEEVRFQLNAVE